MQPVKSEFLKNLFFVALILAAVYLFPWRNIDWGRVSFLPASTVTVEGVARQEVASQVASFTAGVTAENADKQKALDEVNTKMQKLVASVKVFGIPEADIKTQNVSVYEQTPVEIMTYPPQKRGQLQWVANNSLEIKLREVSRASALADLLNKSGATSVNGPNLSLADDYDDSDLLTRAIADARVKAEKIAAASGRKLGKIITVSETGTSPIYPMALEARGGDTTVPIEPGTQTTYKSVTVIFELK